MNLLHTSPFFESQRRGRWRWPWLLLGILLSPVAILVAAKGYYLSVSALAELTGGSWAKDFVESEELGTSPPTLSLNLLMVGILGWAAAIVGTLVQGRPIRSLVAPFHSFRWGLAGKTFFLALSLDIILHAIPIPGMSHLEPHLQFTGLRLEHAFWFVPLFLCILLQTSGEDAFFKGYLLRQFGAVTGIFWIAPVVVTVGFVIIHVDNPDLTDNLSILIPMFVVTELLAIYLLMRSGSMEIPLALHGFNNVYAILFVAEEGTQSNDLSLWVYERIEDEAINRANDIISLVYTLIFSGLLLLAFCWRRSPFYVPSMAEQVGADPPATAPGSRLEDRENPQDESKGCPQ